jgi:Recombination endonuclease VII
MTLTNNPTPTKRCPRCRTRRDPSWFSADYGRPDGLACWCKPCCRAAWRERHWGITPEELDRILSAQGGGCGICGAALEVDRPLHPPEEALTRFCVDRAGDGRVRGFLCAGCHRGLRGFGRDVDRLLRAADYVSGGLEGEGGN